MHTEFWCGNILENTKLKERDIDERVPLRWILGNGLWG